MLNIKKISNGISNYTYHNNLVATEELIELFNTISKYPLNTEEDYIKMYDDNFYTYQTWEQLVKSELEQSDGLTEDECKEEINHSIWRLPCRWYVQYV